MAHEEPVGNEQVEHRHRTHVNHCQHKGRPGGAGGQVRAVPPSCWPTSVETASPMPIIGTQATLLTLKASMVAAWGSFPSPPTRVINSVNEPHSTSHCIPPGAAKVQSRRKRSPRSRHRRASGTCGSGGAASRPRSRRRGSTRRRWRSRPRRCPARKPQWPKIHIQASTPLRAAANVSTTITTRVAPRPVKNEESVPARTTAPIHRPARCNRRSR